MYYWGDIDTHGFAMLHRLPHALSLLMDRETLEGHPPLWGTERRDQRFTGTVANLTELEQVLRDNALGDCMRLEQERIGYGHLQRALAGL